MEKVYIRLESSAIRVSRNFLSFSGLDDLLTGANTVEELTKIKTNIESILKSGNFKLRKWASNTMKISYKNQQESAMSEGNLRKVLGISWNPKTDEFSYHIEQSSTSAKQPTTVLAKFILQELWHVLCIYLRSYNQQNDICTNLLAAKSRVAPLKYVTLPRLELSAAVVSSQLSNKFKQALRIPFHREYYWRDSQITLHWIKSPSNKWKTYVADRVAEILTLTNPSDWYYIRSEDNPADLLTREVLPNKLAFSDLWWHGPKWLAEANMNITEQEMTSIDETTLEERASETEETYQTFLITTFQLAAKSRVAPLKYVTLPRLELSAAVVSSQLSNKFKQDLRIPFHREYYWCDSQITLHWIKSSSNKWETYVANRVAEIQTLTNPSDWYYIRSEDNPADLLTGGVLPNKLASSDLWWNGPKWLAEANINFTEQEITSINETTLEERASETEETYQTFLISVFPNFFQGRGKLQRRTNTCSFARFPKRLQNENGTFPPKGYMFSQLLRTVTTLLSFQRTARILPVPDDDIAPRGVFLKACLSGNFIRGLHRFSRNVPVPPIFPSLTTYIGVLGEFS
ncbi:Pao retrotransposon peptidase [Popillia japonica]|uniref:Pao retrotransposon peptidase n=1 Tax=Popillia japonica TaxID=7064 RepID=A0AAW1NC99_POPJA